MKSEIAVVTIVGAMEEGKTYYVNPAWLSIFGVWADAEVFPQQAGEFTTPVVKKGLFLYYQTRLGFRWPALIW